MIDAAEFLNLTDIDLCVYDKTGTLTDMKTVLGGVICGTRFYGVDKEKELVIN